MTLQDETGPRGFAFGPKVEVIKCRIGGTRPGLTLNYTPPQDPDLLTYPGPPKSLDRDGIPVPGSLSVLGLFNPTPNLPTLGTPARGGIPT